MKNADETGSSGVLETLYRHPIKGLSAESLARVHLEVGGYFPFDRIFAIENGPAGFDPKAAEHLPKQRFLMLMRNAKLAKLDIRVDEASLNLQIRQGGSMVAEGRLDDADGRKVIEQFFVLFGAEELRGPPRLLTAPPNYRFTDSRSGFVSLLNLASVADLARACGRKAIDPRRFRANLHIRGWEPWIEAGFSAGRRIAVGEALLEVIKPIERCAAVDVDPVMGIRDLTLVKTLEREFGHHDCGVYAKIIGGGDIRKGDAITVLNLD